MDNLEEMLNEVQSTEEVEEKEYLLREYEETRKYIFCPSCNRRMFEGLFDGHSCCCHCRGVSAYGMSEKGLSKPEGED